MAKFKPQVGVSLASQNKSSLGMNLTTGSDSIASVFLNRIKQCREMTYGTGNGGFTAIPEIHFDPATRELISVPGDAGGVTQIYLSDSNTTAETLARIGTEVSGEYRLTWSGGPETVALPGVTITSNAARQTVFTVADAPASNLWINFLNVGTWAAPPTNIVLVKTADIAEFEAGQIFTSEYLATLPDGQFDPFRFMDVVGTNNSTEEQWSLRRTPAAKRYDRWPIEVMIHLCNLKQAGSYLCTGHRWTDEFLQNAVALFRDTLDDALTARFTLSNEAWNFIFTQATWFRAQGQAYYGTTGGDEGLHYYGQRSARHAKIVDEVYAVTGRKNYKCVIETQASFVDSAPLVLLASRWQTADPTGYIPPQDVHDEVAIAPYYGYDVAASRTIYEEFVENGAAACTAQILSLMPAALATSLSWVSAWKTVADAAGLELISYEDGNHSELNKTLGSTFHNRNLFNIRLNVAASPAFTVGETVTQAGTGATGPVLSHTGTILLIDTLATEDSAAFNGTGQITGGTSGSVQTPSSLGSYTLKTGILAPWEEALYGSGMDSYYQQHLTDCREAGITLSTIYNHIGIFSAFGGWALYRSVTDTEADGNFRIGMMQDWRTANPRTLVSRPRRTVTWP